MVLPSETMMTDYQFAEMATSNRPDFVIDGYPEYAADPSKLEPGQRALLHRAARKFLSACPR